MLSTNCTDDLQIYGLSASTVTVLLPTALAFIILFIIIIILLVVALVYVRQKHKTFVRKTTMQVPTGDSGHLGENYMFLQGPFAVKAQGNQKLKPLNHRKPKPQPRSANTGESGGCFEHGDLDGLVSQVTLAPSNKVDDPPPIPGGGHKMSGLIDKVMKIRKVEVITKPLPSKNKNASKGQLKDKSSVAGSHASLADKVSHTVVQSLRSKKTNVVGNVALESSNAIMVTEHDRDSHVDDIAESVTVR